MRRTHRWHKSRTMMCPRSRGDYDQGQPVSSKGGKGKEEGFITVFVYSFLSTPVSSVRNETGRSILVYRYLSAIAINVYRDWRSTWRGRGEEGHGEEVSEVGLSARKFWKGSVWKGGFPERLKSIFDFGGDFQRARYVETGIRLTHSMQRDTKAERLVDYD